MPEERSAYRLETAHSSANSLRRNLNRKRQISGVIGLNQHELNSAPRSEILKLMAHLPELQHNLLDQRPLPYDEFLAHGLGISVRPTDRIFSLNVVDEGIGVFILPDKQYHLLRLLALLPSDEAARTLGSDVIDLDSIVSLQTSVLHDYED